MDKHGKLYQDIFLKEFRWFPSGNLADDYYAKVKTITNKGYRQIIFTSSIMLALIEHFLLSHNSCIVNIEFTKEDEELGTIKSLLDMMKINKTYWKNEGITGYYFKNNVLFYMKSFEKWNIFHDLNE